MYYWASWHSTSTFICRKIAIEWMGVMRRLEVWIEMHCTGISNAFSMRTDNLHTRFTLWFTLCSLTGSRCNQQGLGLSGLVHDKAHPAVPDIAQSRLECIDTGCIHRPLVQQIPPINDLAWKKYLVISLWNVLCLYIVVLHRYGHWGV